MRHKHIVKINAQGGIFTPLKLKSIVEIAFSCGAKHINFGPRQEIFLNIHRENRNEFDQKMQDQKLDFELDTDEFPNIVSSYPAEGIFSGDYWLSEGIYKDIFDQFDYWPRLKINICDHDQSLIPLFSGELNFVASQGYQYWFLYLNLKEENRIVRWNKRIYSTDIPKICKEIEELYLNNKFTDAQQIMDLVNDNTKFLFQEIEKELELPRYIFPYYEGMNRYGDKFWLGVYRRNYQFPISFIHELCSLCIATNIGQLCTTTWRTLVVKGIEQGSRIQWEKLLGKHGINLRHSASELNWVVEDLNSYELKLKKHITDQFDDQDIRTFGLVFGIKLQSAKHIPASIIMEEKPFIHRDQLKLLSQYDIYYTENFNPNNPAKVLFAKNIGKNGLVAKLLELCKMYYATLTETEAVTMLEQPKPINPMLSIEMYQCKHCFTIYDERYGDEINNIQPQTPFASIGDNYHCPVCESPKSGFIKITEQELLTS